MIKTGIKNDSCVVATIILLLSVSAMYSQVLSPEEEKVHRNVHFKQYMEALEKFNDYKKTSTHEVIGNKDVGASQVNIQIRSGSGDMTDDTKTFTHEEYCLEVRIGVMNLAEPDQKALSQSKPPEEWKVFNHGSPLDSPPEHCTTTYPDPDPWNLKLNFGPLAIGHAFVVQTTVKSITTNKLTLNSEGKYTDELRKLSEEGGLKLDYEMMENDLRNNIKLGGRRLYLLIKNGDEGPAPVEEDTKKAESDVLSTAAEVAEVVVEKVDQVDEDKPVDGKPVDGELQKVASKEGEEESVAGAPTVETKAEEPPLENEEQA